MARTAVDRSLVRRRGGRVLASLLAIIALALAPGLALVIERPAGGRFLLSATAGGGAAAPRVLLRWVVTEGPSPYATYLLRRRADSEAAFSDLAMVARLTDPDAIEAVFPVPSEIRDDLSPHLVPGFRPTIPAALLDLRGSLDPAREMQYRMLLNTNYGVAIVEGLAYLDSTVVAGTRYLYELWGVDPGSGMAAERLGKVWILAGTDTMLKEPEELKAVRVADVDLPPLGNFPEPLDGDIDVDGDGKLDSGEFGDGKIYLTWNPNRAASPPDRETESVGFGFDILRFEKGDLPVCPDLPPPGTVKVNEWPVLPISAPQDKKKMPDFFFVDDGSNPTIPPLTKNAKYCYWLVARNLLRQGGRPSEVHEACAPDLGRPRQVRDVKAQVSVPSSDGIKISWAPNASDPVTLGGGARYIDDTAAYHIYRLTDFKDLLEPMGSFDACAVAAPLEPCILCSVAAPLTSCTDAAPAATANRGKIYWYVVTALDTPVCDNPANESPYSSPARGVVYDETPPSIGMVMPFCDRGPTPYELPCLRECCVGTQCPPDPFDDNWCKAGGAPGIYARPEDRWGYKVPLPMPSDTMAVRLYRGSKGADFRPVEEAFFSPPDGAWVLEEEFRTRSSQKIQYRLRALDRDSNIGPMPPEPIPAYLQGTAPPPRPTIVSATLDPDLGTALVRWHAPGAEALAGFMLRIGPPDRPRAGDFTLLPVDPIAGTRNVESEHTVGDLDGDLLPEPDVILIKRTTQYLVDLDPPFWGLRAGDGYLEQSLAVPDGSVVEISSIDITGRLSEAAAATPAPAVGMAAPLPWPRRDSPAPPHDLGAILDPDPDPKYVELCWENDALATPRFAVFRAIVEPGRPESYQQRSPRLDIDKYMEGDPLVAGDDLVCGCPGSGEFTKCWRDYGVLQGKTYRYTVLGFSPPPAAPDPEGPPVLLDPRKRNEGEIDVVYGSPPDAAEISVP